MASIAHDDSTLDAAAFPYAQSPTARRAANIPMIVADVLALLGVIATGIALFARGWVHIRVTFLMPGRAASFIRDTFGFDVDNQIAQIANREISKSVPETLWNFQSPYLHYAFGLLVLVAVLLLVALVAPRLRVIAHALAVLAGAGAISLVVIAFSRVQQDSSALSARVGRAILNSSLANRILDLTTGKPQLSGSIGWPIFVAAAGLIAVVLGVLFGLIFAAIRAHGNHV